MQQQQSEQNQNQQQESYNYELPIPQKVIVIGNSSVGKSCILNQYINNNFQEKTNTTIGHDFMKKIVVVNDTAVTLLIWDTAGQEKFRPIIKSYFKGSKAAFLVFSVLDGKSFDDIKYWAKELDRGVDTDFIPKLVLANKCDFQKENWEVSEDKIENYIKREKYDELFYTSAKTGQNIQKAFQKMGELLIKQNKDNILPIDGNSNSKDNASSKNGTKKLNTKQQKKKEDSKGCC